MYHAVPASISLSPNEALLCCMSSPLLGSHVSIQPLPRRVFGDSASTTGGHFPEDLAKLLVTAIRSRRSPSDVIHALEMPALPTEVTATALFQSLAIMEKQSFGLPEMWTAELIGIAAEVYRYFGSPAYIYDMGVVKSCICQRTNSAFRKVRGARPVCFALASGARHCLYVSMLCSVRSLSRGHRLRSRYV